MTRNVAITSAAHWNQSESAYVHTVSVQCSLYHTAHDRWEVWDQLFTQTFSVLAHSTLCTQKEFNLKKKRHER